MFEPLRVSLALLRETERFEPLAREPPPRPIALAGSSGVRNRTLPELLDTESCAGSGGASLKGGVSLRGTPLPVVILPLSVL